jgi:hypothetical protein
MAPTPIVMRVSRNGGHTAVMDIVAIAIGIAAFAILIWMIEGIDRV